MSATPLRYEQGDTLTIRGTDGLLALWTVLERKRLGYLLKPLDGSDPRTWSHDELDEAYGSGRLTHVPCNPLNLPRKLAAQVEKTWEYWDLDERRAAERRAAYCRMVDAIKDEHDTLLEAYEHAAEIVWRREYDVWVREDHELAAYMAGQESRKRRRQSRSAEMPAVVLPKLKKPGPYTIREWYRIWTRYGRMPALLIPRHRFRGNFNPRHTRIHGEGLDTYKLMRKAVEEHYLVDRRPQKKFAYKKYKEACENHGIAPVSDRTFRIFITQNYTERQEFEKRYGRRAAYLKFGIFERTVAPERPLEEVEVDHCLIDLIVVHPVSGRPLGRPWLTVLIDRATRCIVGAHLSFEVPSYASLQRALAHSFMKKNLSGIDGLDHDWPCHGIPEWVICDNGKEFRSTSLRTAEALLDFFVVNLPPRTPWLKGAVERVFGTIGAQVFSFEEGSILAKSKDFYNPVKRAELTLAEVTFKILKWIVDEYHQNKHDTLGCKPIEKWRDLTERYPVRPVPHPDHIIRMTGEIINRTIQNIGIEYEGLLYADKRILEELRSRRGGLTKEWQIRFDPYDLGEVWILDDETGVWLTIPCTDQSISRGVSKYQHKVHKVIAKTNLPAKTPVTVGHLEDAKRLAESTVEDLFSNGASTTTSAKGARYDSNGDLFTPLGQLPQMPSTLTPANENAPLKVIVDLAADQGAKPNATPATTVGPAHPVSATTAPDLSDEVDAMIAELTRNIA